jgi:hypothetical protein
MLDVAGDVPDSAARPEADAAIASSPAAPGTAWRMRRPRHTTRVEGRERDLNMDSSFRDSE